MVRNIDDVSPLLPDLCRRYHVRELALFGSILREDFHAGSDIDVLVEFEPAHGQGLIAFARFEAELADLLQRPVDLIEKKGLKPIVRREVLATARVVYAQ